MAAAAAPPHLFRPPRRTINTVTASPSPSIRAASIFTTAPATREPPPSPHKNCSSAATTNLHLAPLSSSRSSHGNCLHLEQAAMVATARSSTHCDQQRFRTPPPRVLLPASASATTAAAPPQESTLVSPPPTSRNTKAECRPFTASPFSSTVTSTTSLAGAAARERSATIGLRLTDDSDRHDHHEHSYGVCVVVVAAICPCLDWTHSVNHNCCAVVG
ncbi:hypothetical protein DEO72_LG10g2387 [Vigna unguiculata]|uniref:Uncharacterized protein n=1 Tax=Vigna unguiculata TaxID=3917 RepID=A0A4D6NEJ8_VIGUN|nr:hypothetical protein DEO72_LG10g2387 [Vigna unguiculata]